MRFQVSGIKKKFERAVLKNYTLPSSSLIYNGTYKCKNKNEAGASIQRYSDLKYGDFGHGVLPP